MNYLSSLISLSSRCSARRLGATGLALALVLVLLASPALAAPALAQEPTTAAPAIDAGRQKPACAAFTEAEQQEFDSLTAMKDAETLAGADLSRYEACLLYTSRCV